jgi:hypothetical protein
MMEFLDNGSFRLALTKQPAKTAFPLAARGVRTASKQKETDANCRASQK